MGANGQGPRQSGQKLSRRTGKRQEAQEHLANAPTMYREMEMTYWLEKAELEPKEFM